MPKSRYRAAPVPTENLPKGIPYIIANEAAERFSFYGMRGILVVFMTKHLIDGNGDLAVMSDTEATKYFHLFVMSAYLVPLLGALLSDIFLGKYKTIIALSFIYCLGHAALAVNETRIGLFLGLGLIALGSGGIKPCVSAHVGDQFGTKNAHLLPRIFSWFYFSINLGAAISSLLTPWLLKEYGPAIAFGVPGILMAIATIAFWTGRNKFVHIPPGGTAFVKEAFSGTGLRAMRQLLPLYVLIAVFFSLFDQTGSSWVIQAEHMNRDLTLFGTTYTLLSSQLQAVNPFFILLLIPTFSYLLYPAINKCWALTPLRKIGIGLFLATIPFVICAWVQMHIDAGESPSILWQVIAYIILTAAEVFVSITALEFAYTQAPKKMKSWIMTFYLVSIALGNFFAFIVNHLIQNPDGSSRLEGPTYFLFFSAVMTVAAIVFVFVARTYKEKNYIQDEAEETTP
jgi:POT family proton-dependent oligopeptide transporter